MIVFAGSASNYKKISVFLAMIAKPWTLVCCNIPSISLHLFISLFAIFPKYFRTSLSHYLWCFPNIFAPLCLIICNICAPLYLIICNISAPLYLIICATWATANRRKQAAGKEVSVERNIGKNRRKKVGAKSRIFLFSLTELFLPRPNYYSAPAFSTKGHVLVSSGVNTGNYEDARLLIKTLCVPQIFLIKTRHKTWIRSGGTRSISIV